MIVSDLDLQYAPSRTDIAAMIVCKELEMGSNSRDAVCGANAKGSLEW